MPEPSLPSTAAAAPLAGVIFDVDGVLIDSYTPHFQSWRQVAARHGIDYTEEMFATGFGMTSRAIIAKQWGRDDLSQADIDQIDEEKEAAYRDLVADNFPLMPGATDIVRQLAGAGFRVGVGSSGPPQNVELAVKQLEIGASLTAIVTGRDVTQGKPDPQIFLKAAEKLGLPPNRCAVVEDAPAGVAAAKAAGMVCIGFTSTGRTRADVQAADFIINALADLSPELFGRLISQHANPYGSANKTSGAN